MSVRCPKCGSDNLRPSHLRAGDVFLLLTLRYPARCRDCRRRFAVSLFDIRKVRYDAELRRIREERKEFNAQPYIRD